MVGAMAGIQSEYCFSIGARSVRGYIKQHRFIKLCIVLYMDGIWTKSQSRKRVKDVRSFL